MTSSVYVYREYVKAKAGGFKKKTAAQVARDFEITRDALYELVRRVEKGDAVKLRKCTEKSRLDCLWRYKYELRFLAIPKNRKPATVKMLAKLVKEMAQDEFPVARIAAYVGKDHSTIIHHLEK